MRVINASFFLLLLFVVISFPERAVAEEKVTFSAKCNGKSFGDLNAHTIEYNKKAVIAYGDIKLLCEWLLCKFERDNSTPVSISATGYSKGAGERERATARLSLEWGTYSIRCRTLDAVFHEKSAQLKEITATGDVWGIFRNIGYKLHCAKVVLKFDRSGKGGTVEVFSDVSLPRCEIAGPGFIATESNGIFTFDSDSYTHNGNGIEITYDLKPERTIIPAELMKLQAGKLVVRAGEFHFDPDSNTFGFSQSAQLRFGELSVSAETLLLTTTEDNLLPKSLNASKGDKPCSIKLPAMRLFADSLDFTFGDKGQLVEFAATGDVKVDVVDSKGSPIKVSCAKAKYTADLLVVFGDPELFVLLPVEKITGKKGKLFKKNKRWEYEIEKPVVEVFED